MSDNKGGAMGDGTSRNLQPFSKESEADKIQEQRHAESESSMTQSAKDTNDAKRVLDAADMKASNAGEQSKADDNSRASEIADSEVSENQKVEREATARAKAADREARERLDGKR